MRFRFTIRDLLWLALVVALGMGWWVDQRRHVRALAESEVRVRHAEAALKVERFENLQKELAIQKLTQEAEPAAR